MPDLVGPLEHAVGQTLDGVFYVIGGRHGGIGGIVDSVQA